MMDFININQQYSPIEPIDVMFDGETVIDKEQITPFDVIKRVSEATGQKINNPNKNCKKCYGRGYIGRDFSCGSPVPCECIFDKESISNGKNLFHYGLNKMNRKDRRKSKNMYKK